MTNSTETFWSIDGVSLQTYAYNIETWGGDAQSPPPLRGNDTVIPYAVGETYHRKVPGARTMSFGMWVIGANDDGTIPVGGSSRELFEDNWRKLRKLMWNPNRQVNITKRFKDWDTGKIVEATAKAEFAGGLTPTMNGSQRAVFTVQFKLADPFFYGEEQTISISAMTEAARNYAKNPTPVRGRQGYAPVMPPGLTDREVERGEVFTLDGVTGVEVFYLNQPSTKDGGITYGGTTRMLEAVPGEARRYSAVFRSRLGGSYRVLVRFYAEDLTPIGVQTAQATLTAAANTWVTIPATSITAPAGAAYAQLEVVEHPTTGRIPKSCAINRATNPDFVNVGAYRHQMTNLFTNPSFEAVSGSWDLYRNVFTNSALEQNSSSNRDIVNYVLNPKFSNGPRGWQVRNSGPRPGIHLKVYDGGPVGASYMQFNTAAAGPNPTVSTSYAGSSHSGESDDLYGKADGVYGGPARRYYGSAWLRTPSGTQNVNIRLVERRISNGAIVATASKTYSVGTSWIRVEHEADKRLAGNVSKLHLEFMIPGTGERRLFLSGTMLTNLNVFAGYFDGDGYLPTPTGRSDSSLYPRPVSITWSGTRNFSYSRMSLPIPTKIVVPSTRVGYVTNARRTIAGVNYTDKAIYIVRADRKDPDIAPLTYGIHIYTSTAADVGKTVTVVAETEIPNGYVSTNDPALSTANPARSIYVEGLGTAYPARAQSPATAGIHVVRAKITFTAVGQLVRLSGGGSANAGMGWKHITIVRGDYDGPPFSGNRKGKGTSGLSGPWDVATPKWTGTSPWTESVLQAGRPNRVTPGPTVIAVRGSRNASEGSYALEVNRGPATEVIEASRGARIDYNLQPGIPYTVAVTGRIPAGYVATEDDVAAGARSLQVVGNTVNVLGTMPATPGAYTLKATFIPDSTSHIRLGGGGAVNQSVFWDKLTIVQGDVDLEPFTGSTTAGNATIRYTWTGAVNNSTSNRLIAGPVGLESPGDSVYVDNTTSSVRGATILNPRKNASTNYVTFTNPRGLFGYQFGYDAYTIMAYVRPSNLDAGTVSADARRFQVTLADGTVLESPQFSRTTNTQIRWSFDRPDSEPVDLRLIVGHNSGTVSIEKFAVIPVKYDGAYFSGNSSDAYWWGTANASESQLLGDRYWMSKVLVTGTGYTGPYFDGATPNTGTGDSAKTYVWAGTPYGSESIYSIVNLTGVSINLDGDYYTRKIKVIATPPVGAYSIVSKAGDIEEQGYKYTQGVTSKVTVDVEDFSVAVVGKSEDYAYAIEPTKEGYWLELAPGTNTLLLRGVGTGKLEVKYRAAWI